VFVGSNYKGVFMKRNDATSALFLTFAFLLFGTALALIGVSIFGLFLAFKASILLGILALVIEPAPLVIGVVYLFTGTDLAQKVATYLGL
jgi:hypothetical protein